MKRVKSVVKGILMILIILICIIVVVLVHINLYVFIFDNGTNIAGIREAKIAAVDYDFDGDGGFYVIDDHWQAAFKSKKMIKMVRTNGREMSRYNKWIIVDDQIHFRIVYKWIFGMKITRIYSMPSEKLSELKCLKELYEAKETKAKLRLVKSVAMKNGKYVWKYAEVGMLGENCKKPEELIYNMDLELMERSFAEEITEANVISKADFRSENGDIISLSIHKIDRHTLKWLKDNGYDY